MPMSDERFLKIVDEAIKGYRGDAEILESAIGTLAVGRLIGWKALFLMHARPTIKKYEGHLKISFRDELEIETKYAYKSLAWRFAQGVTNFWKAVRGEIEGIRTSVLGDL